MRATVPEKFGGLDSLAHEDIQGPERFPTWIQQTGA
jgi:hypothetical protein